MNSTLPLRRILAADIGGTNSRLAIFSVAPDGGLTMSGCVRLSTQAARSFPALLEMMADSEVGSAMGQCQAVVLAVAGAVQSGRATLPNAPWNIDVEDVRGRFCGAPVLLLNDFVAQAYACRSPIIADATMIKEGRADPQGAIAAVGAGTGLGHCALVPDGRDGVVPVPSEAGNAPFAFVGRQEEDYHAFLRDRAGVGHAYAELVVSGIGLTLAHAYLTGEELQPGEVAARLKNHPETVAFFSRFYGRACRSYALTVVATGGVCITGGVAAKTPELVTHPAFLKEFLDQPRYAALLDSIPVVLNKNENSGLWGAALRGCFELCNPIISRPCADGIS